MMRMTDPVKVVILNLLLFHKLLSSQVTATRYRLFNTVS